MGGTYILDGVKLRVMPPDLDGDGVVGGTEMIRHHMDGGTQDIVQPTEVGEAIKELNKDNIDSSSRLSDIDQRTRIHYVEEGGLTSVQSLVAFRFLPITILSFTRSKMRLAVSRNGLGRQEIVQLFRGKKEMDKESASMFDKGKQFLMGGK